MAYIPPRRLGALYVSPWPPTWCRCRVVTLCLVLLLVPVTVHAQATGEVPEEAPELALELYRRGDLALSEGRYMEASRWFEQALILDPHSAALTYQVAVVLERLGDLHRAVQYYERYLSRLPSQDAEERARIRKTLRRLRAALRPGGGPDTDGGESAAPLLVRHAGANPGRMEAGSADGSVVGAPRGPLMWTLAGTGVGLLMAGALTGVWAARKHSDAEHALSTARSTPARDPRGLRAQANRLAVAADILLGSGALSVGVALVLLWALPSTADAPQLAQLADDGVRLRLAF